MIRYHIRITSGRSCESHLCDSKRGQMKDYALASEVYELFVRSLNAMNKTVHAKLVHCIITICISVRRNHAPLSSKTQC